MIHHLKVISLSHNERTRDPNPKDDWDRGDTITSYTLENVLMGESTWYDLLYDGELSLGDAVHIVYAIYSTGDSFGHDTDGMIEFITAHRNLNVAKHNKVVAESCNNDNNDYTSSVMLTFDDGQSFRFTPPWNGYFESLSRVDIFTAIIGDRSKKSKKTKH